MRMITLDIAAKATQTDLTCMLSDSIIVHTADMSRCHWKCFPLDPSGVRRWYYLLLLAHAQGHHKQICSVSLWHQVKESVKQRLQFGLCQQQEPEESAQHERTMEDEQDPSIESCLRR